MQELSLNVLDVAQNSVTAGATRISITVEENKDDDLLKIIIDDNGCGMTPEQVHKVADPFFTSRTTRKVGLGIPLFKMASELSGGTFSITSRKGVGTEVVATFGRSSIDRMPLGNMCDTICLLIRCNPMIDFVYTYKTQVGSFTLDTREMRGLLEGVPLDTPEVIQFIKQYIEEHTQSIEQGA